MASELDGSMVDLSTGEVMGPSPVPLYRKLAAIMAEVPYIQKDKENPHFRYRYASEQAIKEALHAALVKHGVLFLPSARIVDRKEYQTDKGRRSQLTDVELSFRFVDIETGASVTGRCVGTGDDGADKGTYKAITGAIKYALTSTFLIPTGDDPEHEERAERKTTKRQPDKGPSREVQQQVRAAREAEGGAQPAGALRLTAGTQKLMEKSLALEFPGGAGFIVPAWLRSDMLARIEAGRLTEAQGKHALQVLERGIDAGDWPEPKEAKP